MNLKPVHIQLESMQACEVLRIAMDDDRAGAMEFIKAVLAKKVEKALQRH